MGRLGLVLGSGARGLALPSGGWAVLQRHGERGYALPHEIDHESNLRALSQDGCDRVLAIGSVGGLRAELEPGTFVCPHDFVALDPRPVTALEGMAAHRVAGFDPKWRGEVLTCFAEAGIEVSDGGVYWQSSGPRFETPAEVALIARHADVVGMTLGSECVIAAELELRYAAICVVDNLANGVGELELTLEQVERARQRNRERLAATLSAVLPGLV